jgi:hypothetical protein
VNRTEEFVPCSRTGKQKNSQKLARQQNSVEQLEVRKQKNASGREKLVFVLYV